MSPAPTSRSCPGGREGGGKQGTREMFVSVGAADAPCHARGSTSRHSVLLLGCCKEA